MKAPTHMVRLPPDAAQMVADWARITGRSAAFIVGVTLRATLANLEAASPLHRFFRALSAMESADTTSRRRLSALSAAAGNAAQALAPRKRSRKHV